MRLCGNAANGYSSEVAELDGKGSSKAMGIRRLPVFAVFLVVLCACVLLWFARFQRQAEIPVQMAVKMAEDSASLETVVRRPIRRSRLIMGRLVSTKGNGTADISVKAIVNVNEGVSDKLTLRKKPACK